MRPTDSDDGPLLWNPGAPVSFDARWVAALVAVMVVIAAGRAAAKGEARPPAADVTAAIDRGVAFLAKDAMAWKAEHGCVSCHHAGMVAWAMREAKGRGHAVDEPVLADLTKWIAESGDGKTGVPRPAGVPKALNAKAVWLSLALGADPKPDDAARKGLGVLLKTVREDQTSAPTRCRGCRAAPGRCWPRCWSRCER